MMKSIKIRILNPDAEVKPACSKCGYLNVESTVFYKCHKAGSCPALPARTPTHVIPQDVKEKLTQFARKAVAYSKAKEDVGMGSKVATLEALRNYRAAKTELLERLAIVIRKGE